MRKHRILKVVLLGTVVLAMAAGTLALLAVPRHPAAAAPAAGRVTHGDAQRLFNALFSGCGAVIARPSGRQHGPCADADLNQSRSRISIFLDGKHYCADDWHVIGVAEILNVDPTNPELDTRGEVIAFLQAEGVAVTLDGEPLATTTTPIKQANPAVAALFFGAGASAYWFQTGAIVSPPGLSVGAHTFSAVVRHAGGTPFTLGPITFVVDPSGTGVCLP